MAGNGWKFVLNMSRLVIQLLNCTTDLNKNKFGTDCLGLVYQYFWLDFKKYPVLCLLCRYLWTFLYICRHFSEFTDIYIV